MQVQSYVQSPALKVAILTQRDKGLLHSANLFHLVRFDVFSMWRILYFVEMVLCTECCPSQRLGSVIWFGSTIQQESRIC